MTPDDRLSGLVDGGPAFPRVGEGFGNPRYDAAGMSLRDYFAGQALPAVITATSAGQHRPMRDDGLDLVRSMARDAYEIADAMIEARAALSASKVQR